MWPGSVQEMSNGASSGPPTLRPRGCTSRRPREPDSARVAPGNSPGWSSTCCKRPAPAEQAESAAPTGEFAVTRRVGRVLEHEHGSSGHWLHDGNRGSTVTSNEISPGATGWAPDSSFPSTHRAPESRTSCPSVAAAGTREFPASPASGTAVAPGLPAGLCSFE